MALATSSHDLPDGLDERLRDVADPCPVRVRAGHERVAGEPVDPLELADAMVAECQRT